MSARPPLAELSKRLERLERQHRTAPMLLLHNRRGIPGVPVLPDTYPDGTPMPWAERVYWVAYPGRAPRPLKPGEYEALKRRFGDQLVEPFPIRVGDRRGHGPAGDDEDTEPRRAAAP